MEGQNGTRMSRGWALRWDGSALSQADTIERETGSRGARSDGFAMPRFEIQAFENDNGVSAFARPRSWALEWDGFALAEADGRWKEGAV